MARLYAVSLRSKPALSKGYRICVAEGDIVSRDDRKDNTTDLRTHDGRTLATTGPSSKTSSPPRADKSASDTGVEAHESIVRNMRYLLLSEFGEEIRRSDTDDPTLSFRIERRVLELLGQGETVPLSAQQRQSTVDDVIDDLLGLGPLQPLLDDPTVTEIMVNGPRQVLVEQAGVYVPADRKFDDSEHLREVVEKLLATVGRRLDETVPVIEARMPEGSRINVVMPPLAVDGPVVTIHKYAHDSFSVDDLISFGTLDERLAGFLRACVRSRLNILVSGAAGSGRTTLLNVLASWIAEEDRIVTIEDAAELRLKQEHVVRLETREPDLEGRGGVRLRELVRTSLRMHADRIVVGEVRGDETFEMLSAMGAGHDGWLAAIHAASPADALARFEMLALLAAGPQAPTHAVRSQVSAAFDVIIHLVRLRDGTRRVMHVAEVGDPFDDGILVRDLFEFDANRGLDSTGRLRGRIVPTGLMPVFSDQLAELGISSEQLGLDLS